MPRYTTWPEAAQYSSRMHFRHLAFASSVCIKIKESSANNKFDIVGASRQTFEGNMP
jgi:hypothetical protein